MDSILASVRGEGLTNLSRAPFDVVAAVDETVETLRLLLRPHQIRWDRPGHPHVAVGDETRFRQVLEQLLENESKYAPSADGVSIGVWRVGDEMQVYVTDDGPGVPIEDWESVFEPFVRIEGRGRSRGSGIGLFAARRLMDAMGGRIFLEPNGFASSRFVVALPAGIGGRSPPRRLVLDTDAGRPYISSIDIASYDRGSPMADALTTDGPDDPRPGFADRRTAVDTTRRSARSSATSRVEGSPGSLVGIFVAGLGGRVVMRLATILHEDTVGLSTENGELIGRISFNGTLALIIFGGLGMGLLAGHDLGHRRAMDPRSRARPGARDGARRDRPGNPGPHPAHEPRLLRSRLSTRSWSPCSSPSSLRSGSRSPSWMAARPAPASGQTRSPSRRPCTCGHADRPRPDPAARAHDPAGASPNIGPRSVRAGRCSSSALTRSPGGRSASKAGPATAVAHPDRARRTPRAAIVLGIVTSLPHIRGATGMP